MIPTRTAQQRRISRPLKGLAELGLRLETAKEPVERLSLDHIERPPEK
jgi:uncharacterized protein (TIGR03435 family)